MKKVTIIQDSEDFLVIHKPSGIVVHPYDYSNEQTLLGYIEERSPESLLIENHITLQDGRTINIGGIVHKLDRDTSGVMVITKNAETFQSLKEQFRNHAVTKKYTALVEGVVEKDSFTINAPLGRNKKDYKQQVNPSNPRGELRDAVTDVIIEKRGSLSTLVTLIPKTGRTHQLRAHMSYIGHPIIGDKAYGSTRESERIMLHAKSLSFILKNKTYSFAADEDESFKEK